MSKLTAKQKDKLVEAAQTATEYKVEGSGAFPVDMLRYDVCWPATEAHSYLLISHTNDRRIVLKGLKPPTTARWASFGWRVVES